MIKSALRTPFLLFFGLAVGQLFIRRLIVDVPHHALRQAFHAHILLDVAQAPHQYRVLPAYAAEMLQRLGVSFDWSYLVWHGVWCFLAGVLLYRFLMRWVQPSAAMAGTLFLYALLPLTYLRAYYQEGDALTLCLFLVAYELLLVQKDILLYPMVFLGFFVRETVVFIPLLWFVQRWDSRPWRMLLAPLALWVGTVASGYSLSRMLYGFPPLPESPWFFAANLRDPIAMLLFLLTTAPLLLPALRPGGLSSRFLWRSTFFSALFLIGHAYTAFLTELPRYLLPVYPLLIAAFCVASFGDGPSAMKESLSLYSERTRRWAAGLLLVAVNIGALAFYRHWTHVHEKLPHQKGLQIWHAKRAYIFERYGLMEQAAHERAGKT